jgi:hypothetical protein
MVNNTGNQRLAAYGIDIMYDTTYVLLDHPQDEDIVQPGADGFVAAVNDTNHGILTVSGFDATGNGPGTNLHIFTVHFLAQNVT